MAEAPPVKPLQRTADDADLRMLALLHFAMAFLSVVGIGLLVWQYFRVHSALLDITAWKKQRNGGASLEQFLEVFRLYYVAAGAVLAGVGAANIVSGLLIGRRRLRVLSLLVACLNCLLVPVGTLLAAYTLVVLLRDSVRAAYRENAAGRAPVRAAPR